MKIYHLADLHFGKSIYGTSMLDDQRFWAKQFLTCCSDDKPDAVVIAGDVYDRSAPSGDAVELLDYFLTELAEMDIPVFMIAGNHDSGQRLSFGKTMLSKQNVHIAGVVKKELDHYTFDDLDGYGPVTFWLLPYTFTEQVSNVLENEDIHSYEQAIRRIIEVQKIDPSHRNIIVSHQAVTANGEKVKTGGSETTVGGVGQIDYTAYDPFDYVALGHIHSSYSVGRDGVRYAGTPLCYHMAETRQGKKGFVEAVLGAKGEPVRVTVRPIEPLHEMRYMVGTKEEIYDSLRRDPGNNQYVGITLTDQRTTPESSYYLRQLLSDRGSLLMEFLSDYKAFSGNATSADWEATKTKSLEDLFADLYSEQSDGTPPSDAEYELLKYVGELVRNQDAHQPLNRRDVDKILEKAAKIGGA